MLSSKPNTEQLTLFCVSEYEYTQSRFGYATKREKNNLLTGTDGNHHIKIPVSKPPRLKRSKGLGTGRIIEKLAIVTKGQKEYKYTQPWFCWEEWNNGSCIMRSKYIPKRLRDRIIGMNAEKLPVADILKALS
jgi:hypothetical protein